VGVALPEALPRPLLLNNLCFVSNDYSDVYTIFGTGFGKKKKGPSLAPPRRNFYKPPQDRQNIPIFVSFQRLKNLNVLMKIQLKKIQSKNQDGIKVFRRAK